MKLSLLAAVFAGALIALQSGLIGAFGERIHPFVASVWIHLAGLVVGVIGVLVAPRLGFEFAVVRQAPWGLLAGVAGLFLVTGIAVAVSGLGLASTLAVVTGVQLLLGFVIETLGVGRAAVGLDLARIGGAVLIVVGVYLVVSRGPASG